MAAESSTLDVRRSTFDVSAVPRIPPLLIVLAVWAAIYLPALGSLEIKGEEGRRILPAVTMLETGNYVVPYVGGEPYLRKPPLINWLVAGCFKLFGARNEWTARLPSTLCVLAVALVFLTVSAPSLGKDGALFASLIWLTNFGMIEKGRLIEIEALYVSLFALAFICWLSWWQQRRSAWLVWTVPWIFLGLGLLAKGPLHLLFFYVIVAVILFRSGELRQMIHPAHFLGVIVMLGIFAAWAVPYLQMAPSENTAGVWLQQLTGRLGGDDFKVSSWILNIARAVAFGLPWVLLLLLFRRSAINSSRDGEIAGVLAWTTGVLLVAMNLLPSALPRYTMPLLVPGIWFISSRLSAPERIEIHGQPRGWPLADRRRIVIGLASVIAVAMCLYAIAIVPSLRKREKVRNVAAQFNAAIPSGERVYAVALDYQPFLFYLREPFAYVRTFDALPQDARFLLVEEAKRLEALTSPRWRIGELCEISRNTDYRKKTVVLLAVEPELSGPAN